MKAIRAALAAWWALSASVACVSGDDSSTKDSGSDVTTTNDAAPSDGSPADVTSEEAAGPFTPASLDADGSLALWLQATSSSLVTSNGFVEQWSDLSENHNDAKNPTTGPVVDANAVGGHDALRFQNVTLSIADSPSLRFGTDQVLVAAVMKDSLLGGLAAFSKAQTKTNVSGTIFYQGFELIGTSGLIADGGSAIIALARHAQDLADAGTSTIQSAQSDVPVFDDGKFHIVGARRPNASALTVYADGAMVTNGATIDDDISVAGINVSVGAVKYGKVVQAVDGDIAEVIVVHASIISDATVANVFAYLKARYSL
jgi:hypothetical protein